VTGSLSAIWGEVHVQPHPVDWICDPDSDDDESSPQGFNEPTSFEPGDEEDEEE
jgi:hypothetical protein